MGAGGSTAAEVFARMWEGRRPGVAAPRGWALVRAWWRACRPPFLIVDLIPVALGLALAVRQPDGALLPLPAWPWARCLLVLLGCFLVHTIANIANDLFDYILGVDTDDTIGGTGVIQSGAITPRAITLAIFTLLLAGILVACALLALSRQFWLLPLLFFAAFSAVFYVAPPVRYGHRGFGELFVALNMGFLMVCGTHAVLAGSFSPQSLAFGLPVGLMVAGILYFQSLPEIETDAMADKRTLAVHLGKERAKLVFDIWWPVVWVVLLNLWASGLTGWPVALGLLTIPLYVRASRLLHAAQTSEDWLALDGHGGLVRMLYLLNGLALVAGAFWI